jgi:endoglucanase
MRYNDPSQQPATGSVIGDTSDPAAAATADFQAFWGELAGRFKDNEKVIFGIMNEVCHPAVPHPFRLTRCSPTTWPRA